MAPDIVAIIPALGASKGFPRKNLVDFCGQPLIAWSIEQAHAAQSVAEVYVTSDSQEILAVAAAHGARSIRRPAALAGGTAKSEDVLLHALDVIAEERGREPDLVVFLQATSPLRMPRDIDAAIETLLANRGDSLFSGAILHDFLLWETREGRLRAFNHDPLNRGRRQGREPLYQENGSIYLFRPEVLRREGNRLGGQICFYAMEPWQSQEIDVEQDIETARYYVDKYLRPDRRAFDRLSLEQLDLIVYDFDGVMTDNRVFVLEDGREAVRANRADGLGIDMLRAAGLRQFMISTETNAVVAARARKLRLEVVQGCRDKAAALARFCRDHGVALPRVAYVGNDTNDLEAMSMVGVAIAPADAHPKIIAMADLVTRARGGEGVIRELADCILA